MHLTRFLSTFGLTRFFKFILLTRNFFASFFYKILLTIGWQNKIQNVYGNRIDKLKYRTYLIHLLLRCALSRIIWIWTKLKIYMTEEFWNVLLQVRHYYRLYFKTSANTVNIQWTWIYAHNTHRKKGVSLIVISSSKYIFSVGVQVFKENIYNRRILYFISSIVYRVFYFFFVINYTYFVFCNQLQFPFCVLCETFFVRHSSHILYCWNVWHQWQNFFGKWRLTKCLQKNKIQFWLIVLKRFDTQ